MTEEKELATFEITPYKADGAKLAVWRNHSWGTLDAWTLYEEEARRLYEALRQQFATSKP